MKPILSLLFLLNCILLMAQEAVHNFGNLKIHDNGAVGFHYDFINNGNTDDNLGTVGFFNENTLNISGAFRPVFNDMEIMVADNLFLDVGIRVKNNTNYILGDVITPRQLTDVHIDYLDQAFYTGDADNRAIDGYSSLTNKNTFTFPIGDDDRLRVLTINSDTIISNARSAYFFENPSDPISMVGNFDITQKSDDLFSVSPYEFWCLDSTTPSWVSLQWDVHSQLSTFIENLDDLIIVGWHTENERWENLGGLKIIGDLTSGQISSTFFTPKSYSAITFGTGKEEIVISLGNYMLTPNNDNRNDYLHIEGIENSPNNELKVFNRWGKLVYKKENYQDSFVGKANVSIVVDKSKNLPDGVYFYIIDLKDLDKVHQGYLYLVN